MKSTGPIVKKMNEAEIYFSDTCRFLEDKIVRHLKPDFPLWLNTTYGCSVKIDPGFPEGYFSTHISSFGLDMAVAIILKDIGFDTPCRTCGDMAAGKFGVIPHAAVLKFQKEHHEEIQAWLKTNEHHNFLKNPEHIERLIAASRGKEAV
jgi:hypothetical protein